MNRRDLLKLLGAAGLTAGLPILPTNRAVAAPPEHFWITVNANGGWDPTIFCDPKTNQGGLRGAVTNISPDMAPLEAEGGSAMKLCRFNPDLGEAILAGENVYQTFLNQHAQKTVVINGIDAETNSHSVGSRTVWSGSSQPGSPTFAAMIAGHYGPELPLAFLTNGGYDDTGGLVAQSRGSNQIATFNRLASPNQVWSSGRLRDEKYFLDSGDADIYGRIQQAKEERLNRLLESQSLPVKKKQLSELSLSRSSELNLTSLGDKIAQLEDETVIRQAPTIDFGNGGANNSANQLIQQARLAVAAFSAGLSVSVNLSVGGYDTHSNHDTSAYPRMAALVDGVNYLWEALEVMQIADRTTVVVASDFGRTPYYNGGDGKDHWTITSMLVMGANVAGNRVIGATDSAFNALRVDPTTLEVSDSGIVLKPAHVQNALRRLAGVENGVGADRFPLAVEELELFGA